MGWEYQLTYNQPEKVSGEELTLLNDTLLQKTNEVFEIARLNSANEQFEWGLKFVSRKSDHWVWDASLYLNIDSGLLVFHTGTKTEQNAIMQWLIGVFSENNINITAEEM